RKQDLQPGTEIKVEGYLAKDGAHRANGRNLTLPNGRALFLGSSDTGAPRDGADSTEGGVRPKGELFKHTQAVSFQAATGNQEETDRYWNAIVGDCSKESQCDWCKDRWTLSWQITPRALTDALAAGGGEAKRAFEAMMPMKKIDIATIEKARRG